MRNAPKLPEVLRAVNSLRERFGLKPLKALPKGTVCNGDSCPIFNALRDNPDVKFVNASCVEFHERDALTLPAVLQQFIDRFDDGKYPHLIEA